jgi:hypothetical protein
VRRERMMKSAAVASRFTFDVSREEAHVAQLVEHVLGKDEVTRSIRVVGSIQSLLDPERFCMMRDGIKRLKY